MEAQNRNGDAEIIVVDNSQDGTDQIIENSFANVRLIAAPKTSLVPQLWSQGAKHASGQVIAFTTAHFIPDKHWISETIRHHQAGHAAVGGAVENTKSASLTQWAIFFCRYTKYMLPFSPHEAKQVPGDNASYKRWVLEEYSDLIETGFWENNVNNQLHKDGHTMLMTPAIRVDQGRSYGTWAFCIQRFVHGRIFGAERIEAASPLRRLVYIASSPLIPFVFLAKITREIFEKRRHWRAFLVSFPVLTLFILSWSLGEFFGYLSVDPSRSARVYD